MGSFQVEPHNSPELTQRRHYLLIPLFPPRADADAEDARDSAGEREVPALATPATEDVAAAVVDAVEDDGALCK